MKHEMEESEWQIETLCDRKHNYEAKLPGMATKTL